MKPTLVLLPLVIAGLSVCLFLRDDKTDRRPDVVPATASTKSTGQRVGDSVEREAQEPAPGSFAASEQSGGDISRFTKVEVERALATITETPAGEARDARHSALLHRLAALDGPAAVTALLASADGDFKKGQLGSLLAVWADHDPMAALFWYHAPERDALVDAGYEAGPRFYSQTFRAMTRAEFSATVKSFPAIQGDEQRLAAMESIIRTAKEMGRLGEMLDALGGEGIVLTPKETALASAIAGEK